jgi:catecholate siderophore receptor
MASYDINDSLSLQLNIDNVTDEVYYERIRNNAGSGWATPGSARTGVLSVTWRL